MTALVLAETSTTGWVVGWSIGIAVVFAVVALVVPILLLAHRIGEQATEIDDSLKNSVVNTAALRELNTTIEAAEAIVAGLARGRGRLGG
ncbi:MAG: hypothetical protein P8M16_00335 [Acidimicrobiales bacterium]|jgi:pilus assembly protein TadC|nr:hypothetical protein [Acidimicrobiales bacterium]|tara:strand:+ start:212 stop:481 length:270 start_codon:yes stop_codon:yes gene_type:complete